MTDKGNGPGRKGAAGHVQGKEERRESPSLQSLQEQGISLSHVLDSIQDGISILDKDLNILLVNKSMETWYAHKLPFLNRRCYEVYHGRNEPCEICPSIRSLKSGEADFDVVPLTGADGAEGWLELFTFPMVNEQTGEVEYVIEYVRDITQRKLAEDLLQKSEKKHRALLDAIPDMIFRLDRRGVFLDLKTSDSIKTITDSEQFIGSHIKDVLPPDVADKALHYLDRAFQTGETQTFDYGLVVGDTPREYEARLVVCGTDEAIAIVRDITEHRELEAQLRHAQKMEALGTLTGGLAHEFNNIITAIIGFGELLQDGIPADSPFRSYIDMIMTSAERAGKLTEGMLAYSRRQITHMGIADVNSLLRELEQFLSTLVKENIILHFLPHEEPLTIMADRAQIEQVLINLTTNAIAAMPEGGELTIRCEQITAEKEISAHKGKIPPGKYALISVADTGTGIPQEIQGKVFEPFFTTKDVGKGTGLGLAVVYGIIKKHKGYIYLESEPGKGSTFFIYLPLTDQNTQEQEEPPPAIPAQGKGTVLLAEDDVSVRAFLSQCLKAAGYCIIEAENGNEAIERFREHANEIGILILDLGMPKLNGYDTYQHIRKDSPDTKVVFMSGYHSGDERLEAIRKEHLPFIQKPVKRQEFLARIKELIEKA